MTVTEKRRRGLAAQADEVFGPEHGSTLMELLDPPWDKIATKDDLAALGAELRIEMAQMELRLERSIRTSVFAAMGVQTTVVGVLVGALAAFT